MAITGGVSHIVDKAQALLSQWEIKYKRVWDGDKEAYMRRYEKAQKPLSIYEQDIQGYRATQKAVGARLGGDLGEMRW